MYGRRTKYGNKKVCVNGIQFDSKHEAEHYILLANLEKHGKIHDLQLQKKYILVPAQYEESAETYSKGIHKGEKKKGKLIERECAYLADFDYYDSLGRHIVEDAKGMRTKEYIIKRKLMLYIHGIRITEV